MGRVPPPAGGWRGALGRLREAAWPAGLPSGAGSAAGVAETGAAARGGERSLKERSALFGEALARYRGSWSTVEAEPGGRARGRGAPGAVGEPGAAGGGRGRGGLARRRAGGGGPGAGAGGCAGAWARPAQGFARATWGIHGRAAGVRSGLPERPCRGTPHAIGTPGRGRRRGRAGGSQPRACARDTRAGRLHPGANEGCLMN